MVKFRSILKSFIPPILISVFRQKKGKAETEEAGVWSGDYTSWEEAKQYCTGYGSDLILEKCKNALLKVKTGEAVYERDSVLFDEIQYSWGLLAGLQRVALENDGKLCVLDFGGSLGSTYYQNKEFLSPLKSLQWCIVEQTHFVDCGKVNFENEQLKFYHTIEECISKHKPNVLLLSSVLQYLEQPYDWMEKFVALGICYVIIDRTVFIEGDRDILTIQNVPKEIYSASYPAWFFSENIMRLWTKSYEICSTFQSDSYSYPILNNKTTKAISYILKKIK